MDILAELRRDDRLVIEGLRDRAARDGDRPLVVGDGGPTVSYGVFDERVRRVANGLRRIGLSEGDRVAVLTRRPLTGAVAMFATWRAGLVYTPVNFNLNAATLGYQLADAQVGAIICEDRLLPTVAEVSEALGEACVIVEEGGYAAENDAATALSARHRLLSWADLADAPDAEPPVRRDPADPANIIYTSGTTGRPKGVVQPFRWMNQYTFFVRRLMEPDDVVYNDLPLYHVGGAIFNVGRAVWAGASVAVFEKFSPREFWGRVRRTGATAAVLLDVMIPWLMNEPATAADDDTPLRLVHMQPLPSYHHDFARRFGVDLVTAGFGQTESGLVYFGLIDELPHRPSARRERATRLFDAAGLPIVRGDERVERGFMGRPSPFHEVAILDEADEPVPDGAHGELAVRPRMPGLLLREYFGRPDATAAAVRNLWFHTGDIVRRGADGHAYFVDRAGDRIRSRGENVSSAQVEDLLIRMPGVRAAAVVPVPAAESLEHDIVAFVVSGDGAIDEENVLGWARENLPGFMRPRHVLLVDELPRTATNKVEKYKLRERAAAELKRRFQPG